MKIRTQRVSLTAAIRMALASGLALITVHLNAATLSIESSDSGTLILHPAQDPAYYFFLQQSTDLKNYSNFAMHLGNDPTPWTLYLEEAPPMRFFRARPISIYAPEDTDLDGIDDIYEIDHPVLNPLDPNDFALISGSTGQTYLHEYLERYYLGDGKRQAVSQEVTVFTTRPSNDPSYEAISHEVSIFITRPPADPAYEAISMEVSVFTTRPATDPAYEALSDEVSVFTTRPATDPAYQAISEEISVNKTIPTPIQP